jgi:hypothetical protein
MIGSPAAGHSGSTIDPQPTPEPLGSTLARRARLR